MEVAWNELLVDHLNEEEIARVLSEIEILREARNPHIINLFAVWQAVGEDGRMRVYFVTELMSSGECHFRSEFESIASWS